jgi:hypothetical protein
VVGFQHRLTKEDAMKWFQQKVCMTNLMVYCGEKLTDVAAHGPYFRQFSVVPVKCTELHFITVYFKNCWNSVLRVLHSFFISFQQQFWVLFLSCTVLNVVFLSLVFCFVPLVFLPYLPRKEDMMYIDTDLLHCGKMVCTVYSLLRTGWY